MDYMYLTVCVVLTVSVTGVAAYHPVRLCDAICHSMTKSPIGDIAAGRPTHTSAVEPGLPGSLAVNGRRDPRQRPVQNGIECYHSPNIKNTQQWWYVDLQGSYVVTTVAILTRATCCAEDMQNIRVKVGLSLSSLQDCGITSSEIPARKGTMAHIKCPKPIPGRYVYLTKSAILVLCTVEVYGRKAVV